MLDTKSALRPPAGAAAVLRAIMSAGLKIELEEQAPRASDWRQVGPGTLVAGEVGPLHRFRWRDADGTLPSPGQEVLLALDSMPEMTASVVSADSETVLVATREYVPETAPSGYLAPDPRWISRRLRNRLLEDLAGGSDDLSLAMITGRSRCQRDDLSSDAQMPFGLNGDQRAAIRSSLHEGVTRISAGPGTGKTTLIGALAAVVGNVGRRVLVVAPSNRAADGCALSICERLKEHARFDDGLVVREGRARLEEFRRRFGEHTDRGRIARKRLTAEGAMCPDPAWIAREERRVLDEATVVVAPTAQTWVSFALSEQRFDTVVVDEGGMTSLPEAYHAGTLARRAVVLVGDPRQLPSVVQANDPVTDAFLKCSPLDIPHASHRNERSRTVTLRVQYRMDPDITDLVNHLVYNGVLQPAPSVLARSPRAGPSLMLLDSSSENPVPAGPGNRGNPVHARLAGELVQWLRDDQEVDDEEIALLSRFRVQAGNLRKSVRKYPNVIASTVHRAQGGQCHTVIIDFSEAPGSRVGDYLTGVELDSDGVRLLNVALTRAQRRVVFLAHVPFITRSARIPQNAMSRRIISYIQRHGTVLTPKDLKDTSLSEW